MVFHPEDFITCLASGVKYIPVTMLAVAIALLLGLFFGALLALLRVSRIPLIPQVVGWLFSVIRGIPAILLFILVRLVYSAHYVALMSFFYPGGAAKKMDPLVPGIIALFIFILPILSEAIRSAILSVGRDQYEAGYSVGMTYGQIFIRVAVPQMAPVAIPILVNNIIILIKVSALLFMIGVVDIYNGSLIPAHVNYGYLEGYFAAGLIYWAIFFLFERLGGFLERRTSGISRRS
jgi:L-cystine transport system permease protein